MQEQKTIRTADNIRLNTKPQNHLLYGDDKTTVSMIARVAAVSQMSLQWEPGKYKVGDQFKWEATLDGLIILDQKTINEVREQMLR